MGVSGGKKSVVRDRSSTAQSREDDLGLVLGSLAAMLGCEVLVYKPMRADRRPLVASVRGWESAGEQLARSGRANGSEPLSEVLSVDVLGSAGVLGTLVAAFAESPDRDAALRWAMRGGAATLALCLERQSFLATLADGRIDALTGCLNYRSLESELARELNRADRAGDPLSACFIDLDDFKEVNTVYGHVRANELLAQVGRLLRENMRDFDAVGRFGGDEFVAVLPRTNEVEALTLARRLGDVVAGIPIDGAGASLSASIGVAQRRGTEPLSRLLERADAAMLRAKAQGLGVSAPPSA